MPRWWRRRSASRAHSTPPSKRLETMLLVPTRLAPSTIHGLGVFALVPIAKGTAVWRFAKGLDMEFGPDIGGELPEHVREFFARYGYLDRNMQRVILCFDDARFVNHSETPN